MTNIINNNTTNISNISNLIYSTLKEEEVYFYTGQTEKEKALKVLDTLILSSECTDVTNKENFFSINNITTYTDKDDKSQSPNNIGIAISYPSYKRDLYKKNFISIMKKKFNIDINIGDMSTECFDGEYFIDVLRVDISHRGKGISTILLNKVEEKAKKEGFKVLSLIVCSDNEVAKSTYIKYGFVVDTELDILGVKFNHMVKYI